MNPEIAWRTLKGKECLYFTFKGNLSHADAVKAVDIWKLMHKTKNQMLILVWNCVEMKGYDPMARSIWQKALKELKNEIETVWLISDSVLIRTGASIMSVFTSFSLKVISSENDIAI
jgi:hypothetical protein